MTRPYGRRGPGYSFPEEEQSFSLISFHSLQSHKKWSPPQLWHWTFFRPPLLTFFPPEPEPPLPFFCCFLTARTTWDGSPRRALLDLRHIPLFLIFELFGSFGGRLGPVSTTVNLQTLGHGNGSLQISLHVGPNVLLQVQL